jgi:hypothetical protein
MVARGLAGLLVLGLLAPATGCTLVTRFDYYRVQERQPRWYRGDDVFAFVEVSATEVETGVVPGLYDRCTYREPFTLEYTATGRFEELRGFRATLVVDGSRRIELPASRASLAVKPSSDPGKHWFSMEPVVLPFGWNDFQRMTLETELTVVRDGKVRVFTMGHQLYKQHDWELCNKGFMMLMSV